MSTSFTNINFDEDVNLPHSIGQLNQEITTICDNLPALNIVKNKKLLEFTIEKTNIFKKNKKNFVVFGTGGSNLGARALINILVDRPKNIFFLII